MGSPMLLASAQMTCGRQGMDDVGEAVALELPADLIEAVEGDHFVIGGVEDGNGGVVVIASPIDAGDVGVAGLRRPIWSGSGGLRDAAEDLALVVSEFGFVFSFPDALGGGSLDGGQFGVIDEVGLGGRELEGGPFVLLGVEAGAMELQNQLRPWGVLRKRAAPRAVASMGRTTSCQMRDGIQAASSMTARSRPSPRRLSGLWALRMAIMPPFGRSMRRSVAFILTPARCFRLAIRSRQVWLAIW